MTTNSGSMVDRRERGRRTRSRRPDDTGASLAVVVLVAVVLLGGPGGAFAWNGASHEVVARLAWERLDQETRTEAVRLLLSTRPSVELVGMRPPSGGRRDQILFERAATWPDHVRSAVPDENRPAWHFVNFFWREGEDGEPVDLPEMEPGRENVLTELPRLLEIVADRSASDHERGVALAWVLHLVGDLHQPLHTSARVTGRDPDGDRGGNAFQLHPPELADAEWWRRDNLHRLWDSALTREHSRRFWESEWRYRERLTDVVEEAGRHARREAAGSAGEPPFESWVREGYELAKTVVYPPELIRDRPPPQSVVEAASEVSAERILLAGERLARVLDGVL